MSVKLYEITRRSLEPFLLPLYKQVRIKILEEIKRSDKICSLLDVGGRKSPYTISVPAKVTIIDLPRETEIQNSLNLGINENVTNQVKNRRSNIESIIFGDMTCSNLPDESYDHIVSVEVLEHVEKDDIFVSEISRVLKTGGSFIMTTPNGDFVKNTNPDHKRHYKKEQLEKLLKKYFSTVEVEYAIAGGYYRKLGLGSWSLRRPLKTVASMYGNVINSIQSNKKDLKNRAEGTHHLIAVARK